VKRRARLAACGAAFLAAAFSSPPAQAQATSHASTSGSADGSAGGSTDRSLAGRPPGDAAPHRDEASKPDDGPRATAPNDDKKHDEEKKKEPPGTSTRQEPGKTTDKDGGPVRSKTPDRPVPNYDGRGSHTTVGDVLLWIPRVLASPLYLVSEYLIRRPLGAGVSAAEEANLPKVLYDIFAFGPDHKAGILPTALLDFGILPSVGFLAFWNDVDGSGHDLQLHGSTFGSDWLAAGFVDRIHLDANPADVLGLQLSVVDRPDKLFYGMGPRSLQDSESRYGLTSVDGGASLDWTFNRTSKLHAAVGDASYNFHRGHHVSDDPTVEEQVAHGVFGNPDGYSHGYSEIYSRLGLALDSRQTSGTGVRLDLNGEYDGDISRHPGQGWVKYGATAGAFFDVTGHKRIISVSVTTLFTDPLGSGVVIPFLEQATLGGYGPMKGFLPGRLYDRSAAVGEVAYQWPLWILVDGTISGEVGNVFGDHLAGFAPDLFRVSGSVGVKTVGLPGNTLELLFGVGTETFEHGGQVDSFRLYVGGTNGF
jgi:hypothetical protein